MSNEQIHWTDLRDIVSKKPNTKVLLITGDSSYSATGAQEKLFGLLKGVETERFYGFEVNPKLEDAIQGVKIARSFAPDYILAVGGGSVIDIAKLVNVFAAQDTDDFEGLVDGSIKPQSCPKPLICVPTTFGTGSESTHFAVIYIENVKYSFASPYCLPSNYLLDYSLANSADPYLLACSAFDALCQAIESYWAVSATIESREYALSALELLWTNIQEACINKSQKSLEALSIGANYAGKAINISKTTAPHALSYYLTIHYGIPHGHAVALCFPKFFELNTEDGTSGNLNNSMQTIFQIMKVNSGMEANYQFTKLMQCVELRSDLETWGIDKESQLEDIVSSVNIERLLNHPRKLSKQDLLRALL